jgi:hypothetical protein
MIGGDDTSLLFFTLQLSRTLFEVVDPASILKNVAIAGPSLLLSPLLRS